MAVPNNTVLTYSRTNARQDLGDVIYDISPTDTPILTMAKRMTATARYHEWNSDSLAAHSTTNKHLDGDNDAADASSATLRPGNRTQILKKTASVSGSTEAIELAGTRSEMAFIWSAAA